MGAPESVLLVRGHCLPVLVMPGIAGSGGSIQSYLGIPGLSVPMTRYRTVGGMRVDAAGVAAAVSERAQHTVRTVAVGLRFVGEGR